MLQRLYITTDEYFNLPHASNSGVKEAFKLNNGTDVPRPTDNAAYRYGSALDALLTDPALMDSSGLPQDEKVLLHPMIRALEKEEAYNALFRHADRQAVFTESELAVTFDGLDITVPAKCKFDYWNPRVKFGGDLKSSEARTIQAFIAAAKWFDYDQQAAWYMDITKSDRFVILGISKWNFKVFVMPIKRGDENYKNGKAKYERCASSWWKIYGQTA